MTDRPGKHCDVVGGSGAKSQNCNMQIIRRLPWNVVLQFQKLLREAFAKSYKKKLFQFLEVHLINWHVNLFPEKSLSS